MAYQLYIPSECFDPARTKHLPTPGKPLRIQIEGPKVTIDKLLPGVKWDVITVVPDFPQAAGPRLAALTYHALYRQYPRSGSTDLVVRDESLGWIVKPVWQGAIHSYAIIFDHNVPADDPDPDIFQLTMFDMEKDGGEHANACALRPIDAEDFAGTAILALPRCCQRRKSVTHRLRINAAVNNRTAFTREQEQLKEKGERSDEEYDEFHVDKQQKRK